MRLLVIGDVHGPNHFHLGDEAMLEANLHALRQLLPHIQFTVISGDPEWTSARYDVEALQTPVIPASYLTEAGFSSLTAMGHDPALREEILGVEIITKLKECVGVVISGGGNICSAWPEKIIERVALLYAASEAGIPPVVLGQTVGPHLTPGQRLLVADAFQRAVWIGVRETSSAQLLRTLGIRPERVHNQLDDAFFLDAAPCRPETEQKLAGTREPWIIVTIDASFSAPDREAARVSLVSQLNSLIEWSGGTLVFVPHVTGAHVPSAHCDDGIGALLASQMHSNVVILNQLEGGEFRELVGRAAMVISTRYHPLVLAVAAGIPCLGVYTDEYTKVKLRGALSAAQLAGWCIPLDEAAGGTLFPLALELLHLTEEITARLERFRAEAILAEKRRWQAICSAMGQSAAERSCRISTVTRPPQQQGASRQDSKSVTLTEEQWREYDTKGYLRLGQVLDTEQLSALQKRLNGIMLGEIRYPTVVMQLDTGGNYEALPDPVAGLPQATLAYRKIQGLEVDPLIIDLVRRDLFREISWRHYGKHVSVSIFRVMMMNKPARKGTYLPWHQDAGDIWRLDRDPMVTSWIALDPATRANGCVQVIPGTHRLGLLSRYGSTISEANIQKHCREEKIEYLELDAGEALLLHNWLLHRSDINGTDTPRRALSACYMDGRTLNITTGRRFPVVFGEPEDADLALPFVGELREENFRLQQMLSASERYVTSLVEENQLREQMRSEAEQYARSLLLDNQRREEMRKEAETYAISLEEELSRVRVAMDTNANCGQ